MDQGNRNVSDQFHTAPPSALDLLAFVMVLALGQDLQGAQARP
jgi:hypothetical protein